MSSEMDVVIFASFFRGFVPGEILPLVIQIRNNSRKDVDVLQMRLKQYISYYGDTTFAGFKGRNDVTKEVSRMDRALNMGTEWICNIFLSPFKHFSYDNLNCRVASVMIYHFNSFPLL